MAHTGTWAGTLLGATLGTAARTQVEKFIEYGRELELHHDRVSIRLRPTDPVLLAHADTRQGVRDIARGMGNLENIGESQLQESEKLMREGAAALASARDAFVRESVGLIGVESQRTPFLRLRLLREREPEALSPADQTSGPPRRGDANEGPDQTRVTSNG